MFRVVVCIYVCVLCVLVVVGMHSGVRIFLSRNGTYHHTWLEAVEDSVEAELVKLALLLWVMNNHGGVFHALDVTGGLHLFLTAVEGPHTDRNLDRLTPSDLNLLLHVIPTLVDVLLGHLFTAAYPTLLFAVIVDVLPQDHLHGFQLVGRLFGGATA